MASTTTTSQQDAETLTASDWDFALRNPTMEGPWNWLAAGWRDMLRSPTYSLGYGLAFVAIGLAGTAGLWALELESLVPVVAAGFALLGPILAVGLYEISRRQESGEQIDFAGVVFVRTASVVQMGLLAFFLMFAFLVWLRMALLIYALFTYGSSMPWNEFVSFGLTTTAGLSMLAIGTLTGAFLALVVFAISAISVPILMDRDVDAITAIMASVRAVVNYPGPMLLWAWLVALFTAFGIATMFVGLIVVFPLLGHATWHAYRAIVIPR